MTISPSIFDLASSLLICPLYIYLPEAKVNVVFSGGFSFSSVTASVTKGEARVGS